jgi:DNA-binding NarL/FixJ family response regulator
MNKKSFRFLLVGDAPEDYGRQVLREALAELGTLSTVGEPDLPGKLAALAPDVVIVDAGGVSSPPQAVARILELRKEAKVVVITASPQWKVAKAVIVAGALDYLEKSLSQQEFEQVFRQLLSNETG